jgi:ankyrin repeat protein
MMDDFRDFIFKNEATIIQTIVILVVWLISTTIVNEFRNRRLIQACLDKNYKHYKRWLRFGASLSYEYGKEGIRPLMIACREGSMDIIMDIIANHPKAVHDHDYNGITPLLYAVHNGHLEAVKYLVEQKARVDDPSDDAVTPLIAAASKIQSKLTQRQLLI